MEHEPATDELLTPHQSLAAAEPSTQDPHIINSDEPSIPQVPSKQRLKYFLYVRLILYKKKTVLVSGTLSPPPPPPPTPRLTHRHKTPNSLSLSPSFSYSVCSVAIKMITFDNLNLPLYV